MLKRISVWFYKVSTAQKTLFFLMTFVIFSILVLPKQSADAASYAADVGSPDLSFTYTTEDLYKMAEAYGPEGREAYVKARFTFDVIWPVVYGAFLISAISILFKRSIPTYSWMRSMNLLPVFGMLFDYLENLSTSFVMWRYPAQTKGIDAIAPFFTSLKWILLAEAFGFVVMGFVVVLRKRAKGS